MPQNEGLDMDDSSRKIVLIIGTVTVAALLLMAARYILQSHPAPVAAAAQVTNPSTAETAKQVAKETVAEPALSEENEGFPEEDGFPPMGEPTVNIEQGSNPVVSDPPAVNNLQPLPEQMPPPTVEG
jgi:hypothetical protein